MGFDKSDVVMQVVNVLDSLGIFYLIGGSFASSLYGLMRTTNDADLVAVIKPEQVRPLFKALESDFYVDERSMKRAVETGRHFNVIHSETQFKVDVFTPSAEGFLRSQLDRREQHQFGDSQRKAYFASPEDTVLAKLDWYRRGNEVSDRQWRDITEVLKVQRGRLDVDYLRHWARQLDVSDLLEEALEEADSLFRRSEDI
jgi:hypothetical protein